MRSKKDVIAFTTLSARRLILITWKSKTLPHHRLRHVLYFIKLEMIWLSSSNMSSKFDVIWGSLFSIFQDVGWDFRVTGVVWYCKY